MSQEEDEERTPMVEEEKQPDEQLKTLTVENNRLKRQSREHEDEMRKLKSQLAEVRSQMLNKDLEIKELKEELANAPSGGFLCCFGKKKNSDELAAPGSTSHPARTKGGSGGFTSAGL